MKNLSHFLYVLVFIGTIILFILHDAIAIPSVKRGWKAGVAKVDITPQEAIWMAGFAVRTKPAEGKMHELWAKAITLEDAVGNRAIIVSTDILGFPKEMSERIKSSIYISHGIPKAQILLNSSHTHSGPVLSRSLVDIYPFGDAERTKIDSYSSWLEDKIVTLIAESASNMEEVTIESGIGVTRFQVNRRNNNAADLAKLHELKGPNDHAVPVISVKNSHGTVKALLFSYACHPTVLGGYEWSGDYPGFAQLALEKRYPEAVALFLQGAGGDQNPLPRHTKALAIQYGKELSAAVERVLAEDNMRELSAEIKTNYTEIPLLFSTTPTEKELLEIMHQNEEGTYFRRWAARMHERIKAGESLETSYPYPIQAWTLGDQLILALGGELVVGYALRLKELFGWETFVLGYCNDLMGYVPTAVIINEGGYEGDSSQKVYGLPAKWTPHIEEMIYDACKELVGMIDMQHSAKLSSASP